VQAEAGQQASRGDGGPEPRPASQGRAYEFQVDQTRGEIGSGRACDRRHVVVGLGTLGRVVTSTLKYCHLLASTAMPISRDGSLRWAARAGCGTRPVVWSA